MLATRFNGGGWYRPYNGLQVPAAGPSFAPNLANPPSMPQLRPNMPGMQRTETMSEMEGTNERDSEGRDEQNKRFKNKLKMLGVVLCVLAALSFGIAVSNVLVLALSSGDLSCLAASPVLPGIAALSPLSYFFHIVPNIPPAFIFILSIFCLNLKDSKGRLIKAIFRMTMVNVFISVPIYIIFGILNILHAVNCLSGVIQFLKLILPILIAIFGIIVHTILVYLAVVAHKIIKKVASSTEQDPMPSQYHEAFNRPGFNAGPLRNNMPCFGVTPYNPSPYSPSLHNPSDYKPSPYSPSLHNPSSYNQSPYNPSAYRIPSSHCLPRHF